MTKIDSDLQHACPEYREMSRRSALRSLGRMSALAAMTGPAWWPKFAFASGGGGPRDLIVCVFLRGGADALTICPPFGDADYYNVRNVTAVPDPDDTDPKKGLDLDGFFGLSPASATLKPVFDAGQLAIVHAAGSHDPTRSHFRAQDRIEAGTPGMEALNTGWLGRHLMCVDALDPNGIRCISASINVQRALWGEPTAMAVPDLDNFGLMGRASSKPDRRAVIQQMYEQMDDSLTSVANNIIGKEAMISQITAGGYIPANSAVYPDERFGDSMRAVAQIAKADVGLEAACVEFASWDTHAEQGTSEGTLFDLMKTLSDTMAAFHADMLDRMNSVTVVVMSEFGRRVEENASSGTDHGHGGLMMVMGGDHVAGGQVHGVWPGLSLEQRDLGLDLAVTTDYRNVLAEILANRAGNNALDLVFPSFTPTMPGIVSA